MEFEFSKTGGAQAGSAVGPDAKIETRLSSDNFDIKQFIREVAKAYDTPREWAQHKKKIQSMADRTAQQLKQNVYTNYVLFIDSSKEISSLEVEMYTLGRYLHEQQDLSRQLQSASMTDSKPSTKDMESPEKQEQHSISVLLETVEGGSIITEVPDRYLVHSGTLYELDRESHKDLGVVQAFLLNDSLMTAAPTQKRRGPVKYLFQSLYELENMAIVDVKDTEELKFTFKILMFPDSHLYQAETEEEKRKWIELLTSAKKKHKEEVDAVKKDAVKRLRGQSIDDAINTRVEAPFKKVTAKESPASSSSNSSTTGSGSGSGSRGVAERRQEDILTDDWIKEVPEKLDVCIAQREFDYAVELIVRTKAFLKGSGDVHALRDIRARLNHRTNQLSEVLKKELEASPSGSLRGGPRAARRAVGLLIKLGRSAEACGLFLENYRQIILHEIDDVKMEGAINLYVTNFATTFFKGLRNAAVEFERAFDKTYGSYSTFIDWCNKLLKLFAEKSSQVIFIASNYPLSTISDCILSTMKECDALNDIGLDLSFALWDLYHPYLAEALDNGRKRIREECAISGTAETWEPLDLKTDQPKLSAVILQMESLGMNEFGNLVHEGIIDLSSTTINFCSKTINFMYDVFSIYTPQLLEDFIGCFCDIFNNMVELYSDALGRDENIDVNECIMSDAQFVIATLLPTFITKMNAETGVDIPDLVELHHDLQDTFEKKPPEGSVEVTATKPALRYSPGNEDEEEEEEEESREESSRNSVLDNSVDNLESNDEEGGAGDIEDDDDDDDDIA